MKLDEVRLIDANALKYKNLAEVNGRLTHVLTAEEINNAPTVEVPNYAMGYQDGVRKVLKEVAEGKHRPEGEWITDNLHNTICNKCGGIRRDNRVAYIAFCNKCGAKMKGGENVQE